MENWIDQLLPIIDEYKDGSDEPLDGDSVSKLSKIIEAKINQFRSDYPNIEEFIDESEISIIEFIIKRYETLARKLYKQLEEDYDSRMTDEYISESIIANEWEFHADGKDA